MNALRDGFIVEKVTEGCDCRPLSIMDKHYKGEDYWSDLTYGIESGKISWADNIEGICPLCDTDIIYSEYLVVTEVKE